MGASRRIAYELARVSVSDRNPDEVKVARIGCRLLGMRGSGQNRVQPRPVDYESNETSYGNPILNKSGKIASDKTPAGVNSV